MAFSDLDFRHMFNHVVQQYGELPLNKLQVLVLLLLLGKVTGCRSGELVWISASSWRIKFHQVDKKIIPQLTFEYCFQKNKGPGVYTASFVECAHNSGEVPPVALTLLLLLERKKMIRNALAAYNDTSTELDISCDRFESTQGLCELLKDEHEKFRQKNIHCCVISSSTEDDITSNEKFYDTVLKQVRDIGTNKIPMCTSFVNGRQSSMCLDPSASTMKEFGKFCHYTPTPSLRFGGTCARKGFKQDSMNLLSSTINHEAHILNSMGHCQKVSNVHYADQDAYNRVIPQNILQNNVDLEGVSTIINERLVSPAYENQMFFDQDKTPIIDPIMSPIDLLQKYCSKQEELQHFVCFGKKCSKTFIYEGDWRQHMNSCSSSAWYCGLCNNGFEYKNYYGLLVHMTRNCKNKSETTQKPVLKQKDFNCNCGKSFGTKKGLSRHEKEGKQ